MKAVFSYEIIGEDYFAYQSALRKGEIKRQLNLEHRYNKRFGYDKKRPWIAKILGSDGQFGYKRQFMRGQRDYSRANGTGSRGIFEYFALDPGIYEIHERPVWRRTRRYFIQVTGVRWIEISKEEVEQCINRC